MKQQQQKLYTYEISVVCSQTETDWGDVVLAHFDHVHLRKIKCASILNDRFTRIHEQVLIKFVFVDLSLQPECVIPIDELPSNKHRQ